ATREGFANNVAIGRLQLDRGPFAQYVFKGTSTNGGKNAIYVDRLELSDSIANDLDHALSINPNFTIYFADANVPVTQLDNRLGGRLRWVSSFAGPTSGIDVALPGGTTIRVNKNLRQSLVIDSDGDGIPNGVDESIFGGPKILSTRIVSGTPRSAIISFQAAAGTTYTAQYTLNIITPSWQTFQTVNNS